MMETITRSLEQIKEINKTINMEKLDNLKLDDIDPFGGSEVDLDEYLCVNEEKESLELDKLDPLSNLELPDDNFEKKPMLPRTGGEWTGEPGDSKWIPEGEKIPEKQIGVNPEKQTWSQILEESEIDGIVFEDGEPDFSDISRETVEIDDFSTDRTKNFFQANENTAENRGCSPDDVEDWMKENGYTWHERSDCKTMDKVPSKVHNCISHSGGISKEKSRV